MLGLHISTSMIIDQQKMSTCTSLHSFTTTCISKFRQVTHWTMNRKPRVLRRNSWTEACREFMFIENPWTVRPNPRMVCRKFFQRIHEPNSWLVPCQENHEPPGRTHVVLVRKNMSRQAELMLGILVQWRQLFWAVKGAWMLIFPPAQKTIDEGGLEWRISYGAGGLAVGGTPSGDGIWFGTSWEDDINYVYCV